jgi:DNA-binding transcriptional MerR regulator
MGVYSIKDLERITGIKSHTIRIWEQRYQVVNPERTDTNIRHYCDGDLRRLLNISILNRNGFRISKIANMSEEEIHAEVMRVTSTETSHESMIDGLVIAMVEMCENRFESMLNTSIDQYGFEETLVHILYPFLRKVGVLWLTGTIIPAQEHFISNLIRQKVIAAIDGLRSEPKNEAPSYLLFLPEWELHEMGLLFYYYLLKKKGYKVIYLGQVVPFNDLREIVELKKPEFMMTILTTGQEPEVIEEYVQRLSESFSELQIRINGLQFLDNPIELPENVNMLQNPSEFFTHPESLSI